MYHPAKGALFFAGMSLTIGRDCVNRTGQASEMRSSGGLPGFYRPELDPLRFFAFCMAGWYGVISAGNFSGERTRQSRRPAARYDSKHTAR